MKLTTTPTDIQSLIGQTIPTDYLHQEQERELLEAAAEDFDGYDQCSEEVEGTFSEGDVENLTVQDGAILHKPQPEPNGRVGAIEI